MARFRGTVMGKLLIAGATLAALIGTPALAADMPMPVKAPYNPPPAYNWTGCYIGGNAGVARTEYNATFETVAGGSLPIPLGTAAANAAAYGGQAGCDYQLNSNWVVGLRGMWDGTAAKATPQGTLAVAGGISVTSTLNSETTAFGTVVARVGYSLTPQLMVYGLGGVAYTENKYLQEIVPPSFFFTGNDAPEGWAAGGGLSWMLSPNWDFWVEYNYLGFGNRTVTTVGATPLTNITNNARQDVQTILVGLDLRFTNWAAGQFGPR
jgi:outer membrane immunogenic protein